MTDGLGHVGDSLRKSFYRSMEYDPMHIYKEHLMEI